MAVTISFLISFSCMSSFSLLHLPTKSITGERIWWGWRTWRKGLACLPLLLLTLACSFSHVSVYVCLSAFMSLSHVSPLLLTSSLAFSPLSPLTLSLLMLCRSFLLFLSCSLVSLSLSLLSSHIFYLFLLSLFSLGKSGRKLTLCMAWLVCLLC